MADINDILGNERVKEHFIAAVHHKKISHAYIIEGDKGSGKKMLASAFLKYCNVNKAGKLRGLVESCGISANLVYRWKYT
ncbi:MAG: hypothetical protein ACLRYY_05200 [Anaerobutyricum soehngenii]